MTVQEFEPLPRPYEEAEQNLRIIRDLMERSTKHSTFSGLSGVLAGLYSIVASAVQWRWLTLTQRESVPGFLALWSVVVLLAVGTDYVLTKRKARFVGKTIRSRLGQQMALASAPGLLTGALLTLSLATTGHLEKVYPFWMLCYGVAVCAVALFSQKEVARLGWAFMGAGVLTLGLQHLLPAASNSIGLLMTAVAFGGFHIVYGITVSRRDGW